MTWRATLRFHWVLKAQWKRRWLSGRVATYGRTYPSVGYSCQILMEYMHLFSLKHSFIVLWVIFIHLLSLQFQNASLPIWASTKLTKNETSSSTKVHITMTRCWMVIWPSSTVISAAVPPLVLKAVKYSLMARNSARNLPSQSQSPRGYISFLTSKGRQYSPRELAIKKAVNSII